MFKLFNCDTFVLLSYQTPFYMQSSKNVLVPNEGKMTMQSGGNCHIIILLGKRIIINDIILNAPLLNIFTTSI